MRRASTKIVVAAAIIAAAFPTVVAMKKAGLPSSGPGKWDGFKPEANMNIIDVDSDSDGQTMKNKGARSSKTKTAHGEKENAGDGSNTFDKGENKKNAGLDGSGNSKPIADDSDDKKTTYKGKKRSYFDHLQSAILHEAGSSSSASGSEGFRLCQPEPDSRSTASRLSRLPGEPTSPEREWAQKRIADIEHNSAQFVEDFVQQRRQYFLDRVYGRVGEGGLVYSASVVSNTTLMAAISDRAHKNVQAMFHENAWLQSFGETPLPPLGQSYRDVPSSPSDYPDMVPIHQGYAASQTASESSHAPSTTREQRENFDPTDYGPPAAASSDGENDSLPPSASASATGEGQGPLSPSEDPPGDSGDLQNSAGHSGSMQDLLENSGGFSQAEMADLESQIETFESQGF